MKDKEISENNHPVRYGGDTEYECIKVLKAWLNEDEYKGFLKGNAIKYLCRLGKKDSEKNELEKSMWYINKLMEEVEDEEEKELINENRTGY
jgi:hypothetical protein